MWTVTEGLPICRETETLCNSLGVQGVQKEAVDELSLLVLGRHLQEGGSTEVHTSLFVFYGSRNTEYSWSTPRPIQRARGVPAL